MDTKPMLTSIKKAVIELLILKLLSEQDMYGYQITQEFKKRSRGLFTILEGSMYPILYRLMDSGYITSYRKQITLRQSRVYYHLEVKGIDRLQDMTLEYQKAINVINFLLESSEGDTYE